MTPKRRPQVPFTRGVCPIPRPDESGPCGEPGRLYYCGWRCEKHRPRSRS